MSNYSYNVVIERLKAFATGHYQIRKFSHGQIDVADMPNDYEYPFMHVVPVSINPIPGEILYNFQIIFADLPRDKEAKAEYQRESISDCARLALDLIAEIQSGRQLFGTEVEIETTPTIEPFIEEYKNTLTGVDLGITIKVPYDWSACDIPADYNVFQSGSSGGSGSGGGGITCEDIANCPSIVDLDDRITALESSGGAGLVLKVNGTNNASQGILNLVDGDNTTVVDNGDGSVQVNVSLPPAFTCDDVKECDDFINLQGQVTDLQNATSSYQLISNLETTTIDNSVTKYPNNKIVQTALAGKSDVGHTHSISGVTGLQTALDGKASTSHSHAISDVTGLQTALDNKVDENAAITGATKTKITYDSKGLVTAGADITASDISDASGVGKSILTLTNPGAVTYLRINADNTVTARTAAEMRSDLGIIDTVSFAIDLNGDTVAAATTTFYNPYAGQVTDNTTEANRQAVIPFSGTLKNLFIQSTNTQSSTGSLVFTVRKNGADTAVTVTIPANGPAQVRSDTVNSVSVSAGDLISIKAVNNPAAAASCTLKSLAFVIERNQ